MYKVLVADNISSKCVEMLEGHQLFEVLVKVKMSPEELCAIIPEFDVIIVRSETKVTAEVIKNGLKLKVIGRAGIGLDNIDVEAAQQAGIHVLNANESSISVAEHTIGMILALARYIPQAHSSVKGRFWEREKYMGIEIHDKMLGILGLGKIGTEVAIRAKALGMRVVAYDPYCPEEKAEQLDVPLVSLDYLLTQSDFITLHLPKNDETIDLISFSELALCKKNARIVNMSRGGILNEKALVQALNEETIAGAALDVFENEPYIDGELLECPKVITTPHIGASTVDAQIKIAISLASKIIDTLTLIQPLEHENSLVYSPTTRIRKDFF